MSRLLTLALVETTRNPSKYAVAAYDIDRQSWVYFKGIPMEEFLDGLGNPVWDIFSITEADYIADTSDFRPGIANLAMDCRPTIISQVTTEEARLQWLEGIADYNVRNIYDGPEYFGLIAVSNVTAICFRVNNKKSYQSAFTLERPFYWEARLEFEDSTGERWNLPCKDLRWKTYFWERVHVQNHDLEELYRRWLTFLNEGQTFFIVEIYPPMEKLPGVFGNRSGHYAAVSGIISIPSN